MISIQKPNRLNPSSVKLMQMHLISLLLNLIDVHFSTQPCHNSRALLAGTGLPLPISPTSTPRASHQHWPCVSSFSPFIVSSIFICRNGSYRGVFTGLHVIQVVDFGLKVASCATKQARSSQTWGKWLQSSGWPVKSFSSQHLKTVRSPLMTSDTWFGTEMRWLCQPTLGKAG